MKWWEWIVVGCTVVNVGIIVVAFWVFSDVLKAVVLIKGEAAKGTDAPSGGFAMEPTVQATPATKGDLPVMPRWMDPASEKGLEWLAYDEIIREPSRFSEADHAEAEAYFARLEDT